MPYVSLSITPPQVAPAQKLTKNHLYVGFSTVDPYAKDSRLYDKPLIRQDILNQFNVSKGERLMDPGYGTIIWESLYEPFTDSIKNDISADIARILKLDPRVIAKDITIIEQEYGMLLEITLAYEGTDQTDILKLNFDKATGKVSQ